MKVSAADMPHVLSQFNSFHEKLKNRPNLYAYPNSLTVTLDTKLLHFANAAAGHSGFKSGARPIGIRVDTDNSLELRNYVFSSIETFIKFLEESDADGIEYIANVKKRHAAKKTTMRSNISSALLNTNVADYGRKLFGNDIFMKMANIFGKDVVSNDMKALTVNEFSLRYGIDV